MTAGYTAGLSPRVVDWGLSPGYYRHVPSLLSQELKGKSYHICYQKTWTAGYAGLSPKAGDQGFLLATFIGIQRNYSSKVVPPLTATSLQRPLSSVPKWPLSRCLIVPKELPSCLVPRLIIA